MAAVADVAFLDKALADLETARKWTPRTLSKLEALINSDDPWATYRVDPIRFAAARGVAEQEAIDLFLHAARLGLFQMEWRLLRYRIDAQAAVEGMGPMTDIPAVQEALKGLEAKPELAQLKGIQESVPIRRVRVK